MSEKEKEVKVQEEKKEELSMKDRIIKRAAELNHKFAPQYQNSVMIEKIEYKYMLTYPELAMIEKLEELEKRFTAPATRGREPRYK